jgi:hypothetical protein
VVEFKTHASKSFVELVAQGVRQAKPQHCAQMQIYMRLTGLTRALYLAVNKNTDDLYVERVELDVDDADRLLAKAGRIIFAARPPERVSEDPAWYECRLCDHAEVCRGQAAAAVNCRSCLAFDAGRGRLVVRTPERALSDADQRAGCDQHLYLPDLVPGEQIDAGDGLGQLSTSRWRRLVRPRPRQIPGGFTMTLTLRPYQQAAIDGIYEYFERATGNPLVIIPTGGGKSLVMARFIEGVLKAFPDQRILIVTHVRELIEQNHAEMMRLWPEAPAGIYSAGLKQRGPHGAHPVRRHPVDSPPRPMWRSAIWC